MSMIVGHLTVCWLIFIILHLCDFLFQFVVIQSSQQHCSSRQSSQIHLGESSAGCGRCPCSRAPTGCRPENHLQRWSRSSVVSEIVDVVPVSPSDSTLKQYQQHVDKVNTELYSKTIRWFLDPSWLLTCYGTSSVASYHSLAMSADMTCYRQPYYKEQ